MQGTGGRRDGQDIPTTTTRRSHARAHRPHTPSHAAATRCKIQPPQSLAPRQLIVRGVDHTILTALRLFRYWFARKKSLSILAAPNSEVHVAVRSWVDNSRLRVLRPSQIALTTPPAAAVSSTECSRPPIVREWQPARHCGQTGRGAANCGMPGALAVFRVACKRPCELHSPMALRQRSRRRWVVVVGARHLSGGSREASMLPGGQRLRHTSAQLPGAEASGCQSSNRTTHFPPSHRRCCPPCIAAVIELNAPACCSSSSSSS